MLIENEILVIRNMRNGDILPLYQLLSNEDVMKYVENIFTYGDTENFAHKYGLNDKPLFFQ